MPKPGGRWYSYAEQAAHYRQAARDRGCTCPDLMAPHTHLLECPLYEVPGGTPRTFHWHAPAGGVTISPPGGHAAKPVSSTTETETEPEGAGKDSPPSGAGVWHNHSDASSQTTHLHLGGEMRHSHARGQSWLCWWNGREPMPAHDLPKDTILLGPPIGDGALTEHLDQEHDADDGRPWL